MISESFVCLRKCVLQYRNPGASGPMSVPGFYGAMIHTLFYKVTAMLFEKPDIDIFELSAVPDQVLSENAAHLFELSISEFDALRVLHDALPNILQWFNRYGRALTQDTEPPRQRLRIERDNSTPDDALCLPRATATFTAPAPAPAPAAASATGSTPSFAAIYDILENEEPIWSPLLGLKGTIDATVRWKKSEADRYASIGAVELKTGVSRGRAVRNAHSAQVLLYMLLLSDRYDTQVTHAMLSYIPSTHRQRSSTVRAAEASATFSAPADSS